MICFASNCHWWVSVHNSFPFSTAESLSVGVSDHRTEHWTCVIDIQNFIPTCAISPEFTCSSLFCVAFYLYHFTFSLFSCFNFFLLLCYFYNLFHLLSNLFSNFCCFILIYIVNIIYSTFFLVHVGRNKAPQRKDDNLQTSLIQNQIILNKSMRQIIENQGSPTKVNKWANDGNFMGVREWSPH